MLVAIMLVCATADVKSCEVVYNTTEVFLTQEACVEDLAEAKAYYSELQPYYIETGCITVPGDSA